MGLYSKLPEDIKEVDVIIAGGGTAGCIIAARLAEAKPDLSILVIEGGQNNYNVENIVNPALFFTHLAPTSKTTIFYKGKKKDETANRDMIVPCGGTLGGSSSINFMKYTRAQRSDFDSWKTEGWGANDLLPFLKKLETYHGEDPHNVHGRDGPINVSDGPFRSEVPESDFIQAMTQMGWPEIADLQTLDAINGVQRWKRYVSPEGKRQDTAHRYLHPRLQDGKHPNLHVLCESKVLRVLFDDDKRAVGVECTPNPDLQLTLPTNQEVKVSIKVRKLVVVSSGACGTPIVLERSGLGDPEILKKAGVPVVVDLPGVGRDYQDHNLIIYPYRTNLKPEETMDSLLSGRVSAQELLDKKHPMMGWNTVDISSKLRLTDEDVESLGPEFKAAYERDFAPYPDKPLMLLAMLSGYLGDHSAVPVGQYVSTGPYTGYPYSRGHIHITGPELRDELDFDLGFMTDPHDLDLKKQIWAYKKQREVMRRTKMYRGELAIGHPKFPEGSPAACVELNAPLENVTDLPYSAEDEKAIEQWIRENMNTTWHSVGTCKMAPREEKGVADKHLNVYGTQGLKIADVSILPENVGANTNNTALVIGEKAADIIIKELS